jgi:hypothetical protein
MTKRERARVVELLRCAADVDVTEGAMVPITRACRALGLDDNCDIWWHARNARIAVDMESLWPEQHTSLLEAALRVEQGDWP